jgi:putative phage-type endonuclease
MERCTAITGSEISTYLGLNKFQTRSSEMFKKVFGLRTPDNPNMAHGRKYEPVAIAKFEAKTGSKVYYVNFIRHPEYEWIGGTFDGLAIMPNGEAALIEVKCPPKRSIGKSVPDYYMPQVQIYLAISGLDTAYFVQYKPAYTTPKKKLERDETLSIIEVKRDQTYINNMLPVIWNAWVEICARRASLLPLAKQATSVLVAAWRLRKRRWSKSRLDLACGHFKYARDLYYGIYELTKFEMKQNEPQFIPTSKVVNVITSTADDGDENIGPSPEKKIKLSIIT